MTTSTEQDIIKQVVKKGQLADPYRESQQYIAGSQWEGQEDDKEQFEKD